MRLRPSRALAGYLLAGVVMLLAFLYLRFPGEAVTDYVKAQAAGRAAGMLLSIDRTLPSLPPGVRFASVTIGFRDRPEATFQMDSLAVRPSGLSLLRGRVAMLLEAVGYGGEATGRVDFSEAFSLQGPLTAAATLRDVRVEKCAWLRESLARQVTGLLKASASYSGTAGALQSGTASVDFTITNGTYPLLESYLGFEKIDFSRIDGKLSFRNGAWRITQLTLTGEKLRCSLKGNILPAEEFRDSQIDLTLTLEIPVQGNKRVTMAVGGTIANPQTRVM
jgi:type II secretion system protein N